MNIGIKEKYVSENRKYEIVLFAIVFFLHLIFNFMLPHMSSFPTEILSKVGAAYFAGLDWASMTANADFYGTGFYLLLTPLFYFVEDPVIIRQITLALVVLIVSLQAIIVFKIITEFLSLDDYKFASLLSFAISFLPVIRSNVAINEPPLEFLMWLILYLFLSNLNNSDKKIVIRNTVFIAIILCYTRTIHERALTFIVAFIITSAFCMFFYKKKGISIIPFIVTMGVGYYISELYVDFARNTLWGEQSVTNSVDHMSGKASDAILRLLDPVGFRSYLNIILSEILTANIHTCGFFVVSIILFLICIVTIIKKFFVKKESSLQEVIENTIFILFGISIVATILIMGLLSLNGAIISLEKNIAAKSYCYLRYFFVYYPPVFMLTMVRIYKNMKHGYRILLGSVSIHLLLSKYVAMFFAPIMNENPSLTLDRFHYFSSFSLRKADEPLTSVHVLVCIVVVFLLYMLWIFLCKKKKICIIVGMLTFILIYEYTYSTLNYNKYFMDYYYSFIDTFQEKIYSSENILEEIETVYIENKYGSWNAIIEMPELEVYKGMVKFTSNSEVLLADKVLSSDEYKGKYYVVLDENEVLYFADENIKNTLSNEGYDVVEIQ